MSILSLPSILALFFVFILFSAQIIKRSFLARNLKKIFWIPIATLFSLSVIFSVIQYNVWVSHGLIQTAPEQADSSVRAFLFNAFMNHFAPHLLALLLAGVLAALMIWLNKRSNEQFFEREEILIAFLSGFLAGFPGFLFFLFGIVIIYFIVHLTLAIFQKTIKSGVIPLYYFWLPISASVILISLIWLPRLELWKLLAI